jgi:hypothetical protein
MPFFMTLGRVHIRNIITEGIGQKDTYISRYRARAVRLYGLLF